MNESDGICILNILICDWTKVNADDVGRCRCRVWRQIIHRRHHNHHATPSFSSLSMCCAVAVAVVAAVLMFFVCWQHYYSAGVYISPGTLKTQSIGFMRFIARTVHTNRRTYVQAQRSNQTHTRTLPHTARRGQQPYEYDTQKHIKTDAFLISTHLQTSRRCRNFSVQITWRKTPPPCPDIERERTYTSQLQPLVIDLCVYIAAGSHNYVTKHIHNMYYATITINCVWLTYNTHTYTYTRTRTY